MKVDLISENRVRKIVKEEIEKKTRYLEHLLETLRGKVIDIEKMLQSKDSWGVKLE